MMPFAHGTDTLPTQKLPTALPICRLGLLFLCTSFFPTSFALAQTSPDISQAIAGLNSPRFFERNAARQQISTWLADSSLQPSLTASLHELLQTSTSFEARLAARQLLGSTVSSAEPTAQALALPSLLDWEQKLSLLDSDVFAQRQAASESLSLWRLRQPVSMRG